MPKPYGGKLGQVGSHESAFTPMSTHARSRTLLAPAPAEDRYFALGVVAQEFPPMTRSGMKFIMVISYSGALRLVDLATLPKRPDQTRPIVDLIMISVHE